MEYMALGAGVAKGTPWPHWTRAGKPPEGLGPDLECRGDVAG